MRPPACCIPAATVAALVNDAEVAVTLGRVIWDDDVDLVSPDEIQKELKRGAA